jgi:hypothetical protein
MPPRIKSLTYKVIPDKSVDYDNAPKIIEETEDFTVKMDHKKAIFELKGNFTSVQDARAIVDDFLERWQVIIGIENDPDDLKFKYVTAELEQIQENGTNRHLLGAHSSSSFVVSDHLELHVSRNKLPNRPHKFILSPDVMTMYERYKLFRKGRESLTSMAYMCLTILEASARGSTNYIKNNNLRGKASSRYNIDYDVLDNLAMLVSTKGDQIEARKVPKSGIFNPLKNEEREWIIRAIKVLIRRTGEWAHDSEAPSKQITKSDI